jgi:CRP/FNR family transcriptional regulator
MELKRGQIIDRSEESPFHVYFIETGFVKAYAITKYGEENLMVIRKDSEVFPLIRTYTGLQRDIVYEAMGPSVVWRRESTDYLQFVDAHPQILPLMLDMAISMYLLHSMHLNSLEYRTVRERVISFLLILEHRFGRKTPTGVLIDAPIRRQDIASSVSATRETTSRVLASLSQKHLIASENGNILIPDPEELRKLL